VRLPARFAVASSDTLHSTARFVLGSVLLLLLSAYASLWWSARGKIAWGQTDFISYYTAAGMMQDRMGSALYDLNRQSLYQDGILRSLGSPFRFQDGLLAYNHPPFEIAWYLPLARLSYLPAYIVWVAVSFACFVAGVWLLARSPGQHWTAAVLPMLASLAFFPVFIALLQGQDSATLFLFWVLAYRKMRQSRDVWAGVWLSLMLQKFQILIPTLFILVLKKRGKILAGFLGGSVLLLGVSLALVGFSGLESYLRLLAEMSGWIERKGIYPSQMHNLRGQFYALFYQRSPLLANGLTAAASVAMLALLWTAWKGEWEVNEPRFGLKFSLLVTISVLVSPHLNFHDLAVLLLPGLILNRVWGVEDRRATRWQRVVLWLVAFPVMLTTLMIFAHVPIQLSVWGITAVSLLLLRCLHRQTECVP